jgi:hypothetical protein
MSTLLHKMAAQFWQGLGNNARARLLTLKGAMPVCFREGIQAALQQNTLQAAIQRILASPPHLIPDDDTLQQLRTGWGNEGYSAPIRYLQEVAIQVVSVNGAVLECGTGVTTILMGLLGGRRGITIWSLEHDAIWYAHIEEVLRRYRIPGVELCLAPIKDNGQFGWYDPPLQRMPSTFDLVICDGPPQKTTLGGRYGLLPSMRDRLIRGSVILMDDAIPQARTIQRWKEDFGVGVELVDVQEHTFAIIRPQ